MIAGRCFLRPHDWEPRKAHVTELYSDLVEPVNGEDIPVGWKTEVLYVCKACGKPKVKNLTGRWALEEITR